MDSPCFRRTVVLRDWWLIKCSKEFEGKRFGVAGTQIAERGAVRVFTSSPIITAFDVFTLQASDGVCIILRGFLNKQRLVQSGFLPEISREFIFGFPPCWESKCNNCFVGVPSGAPINSVIDKEDSPALFVEKNKEQEVNDKDGHRGGGSTARNEKPARKRSLRLLSNSVEASKVKNQKSEGLSQGAKSSGVEKDDSEGNERKIDESKVKEPTNGGDHVSKGLDKAKSSDVEKDDCEVIDSKVTTDKVTSLSATGESLTSEQGVGELEATKTCPRSLLEDFEKSHKPGKKEISKKGGRTLRSDGNVVVEHVNPSGTKVKTAKNKRKLDASEVLDPTTNGADHGSAGLNKAKGNDVQRDECVDNEDISPADGSDKKHTSADNVDKITSMSANGESLTSERGKGELEATKACPHSLFDDSEKSSGKRGKKAVSKKSGRTLRSAGNVVEHVNHSETKVKTAKNKRKHDEVSEVQDPTTNGAGHVSEGLNKAKGNGVERDECMDDEKISTVDGCGKMHSGTNSKKITSKIATLTSERRKGKLTVTKASLHSLPKEVSDSSKPGKRGKSKKSEKIRKGDLDVVEPMTPHSGSKVKGNLSVGKTIRKIDFDEEVTPEKDVKKQKTISVSADSLGQKRSRSGRVLVSSLEYWRNQVPVYDADRNLIQVNEGHQTNSAPPKGKGSVSRKRRR